MNDFLYETEPDPPGTPWGLWATAGFTLILVIAVLAVQIIMAMLFTFSAPLWAEDFGLNQDPATIAENGLFLSVATLAAAPVAVVLCILFCRMRKGITAADYLGWHKVDRRTLLQWLGFLALFAVGADALTWLTQGYVVHEFIIDTYRTAQIPALLWLALIVGAPLYEEFIFRGFVFEGLRHAAPGPAGAIVITSALWALLHMQYDAYAMGVILVFGLFLGVARVLTGSLMLTVLLHALLNLASMVQLLVYLWWSGTP